MNYWKNLSIEKKITFILILVFSISLIYIIRWRYQIANNKEEIASLESEIFSYNYEDVNVSETNSEITNITNVTTNNTTNTMANNTVITDIYAKSNVSVGFKSQYAEAGGLIGNITNKTTVTNAYAIGDVLAESTTYNSFSGGLIACANYNATITNAYAIGNVTAQSEYKYAEAGGLIGFIGSGNSINKVYSACNVIASSGGKDEKHGEYAGGLIGLINSTGNTITDAYSISNTNAVNLKNAKVGGLVGKIDYNSNTITNTYAVGKVSAVGTGTKETGGLIGSGTATVVNSYWSPKTTGQETSAGGDPKSIQELLYQSAYNEWDFTDVWTIEEGESLAYFKDVEELPKPDGIQKEDLEYETRVAVYVKDDNGISLADAEFEVKNEAGETVGSGKSNSKGVYYILDLKAGTYTVQETKAPTSYVKDDKVYTFKLTDEGTTVDAETGEEIILEVINESFKIPLRNVARDTEKRNINSNTRII